MRLQSIWIAAIFAVTPTTLWAQDSIPVETEANVEQNRTLFDWTALRDSRAASERGHSTNTACATQSDIITAGASQRPRYDANGALIRAPAATCAPPPATVHNATEDNENRLIVDRESSGGCNEDRLTGTRTCRSSGSITIGNNAEGNERTRQAVEDMLDNLQLD